MPAGGPTLAELLLAGQRYLPWVASRVGQDAAEEILQISMLVMVSRPAGSIEFLAYVEGTMRNLTAQYIRERILDRNRNPRLILPDREGRQNKDYEHYYAAPDLNPEWLVLRREKRELVKAALAGLPPRDREVLVRFYFQDQTREYISRVMKLTPTQFRLLKSIAKGRFAARARELLQRRGRMI